MMLTAVTPAATRLDAVAGVARGSVEVGAVVARHQTVPMHPALTDALPVVQRGWVLSCDGLAAATMALLIAAGPSQEGRWVACAGWPQLNLQAAQELGVALERVVAVPSIPAAPGLAADVMAAMIDGFEVVVASGAALTSINAGVARTLHARASSRGAVLIVVGPRQPFAADLTVTARSQWFGLGDGAGAVRARQLEITVGGRRAPRQRAATVWAPDERGCVSPLLRDVDHGRAEQPHIATVAS